MMWFSKNPGRYWDINQGVTERFRNEVRLIREMFSTEKTGRIGRETSTTRVHVETRTGPVEVILRDFRWDGVHQVDSYKLPFFRCEMLIFSKKGISRHIRPVQNIESERSTFIGKILKLFSLKESQSNRSTSGSTRSTKKYPDENIVFNGAFNIEFGIRYPGLPPNIRMEDVAYHRITDHHGHHIFREGILCIFEDRNDWNPSKSTALTAILVAIDWIAWHYSEFGKDF